MLVYKLTLSSCRTWRRETKTHWQEIDKHISEMLVCLDLFRRIVFHLYLMWTCMHVLHSHILYTLFGCMFVVFVLKLNHHMFMNMRGSPNFTCVWSVLSFTLDYPRRWKSSSTTSQIDRTGLAIILYWWIRWWTSQHDMDHSWYCKILSLVDHNILQTNVMCVARRELPPTSPTPKKISYMYDSSF